MPPAFEQRPRREGHSGADEGHTAGDEILADEIEFAGGGNEDPAVAAGF